MGVQQSSYTSVDDVHRRAEELRDSVFKQTGHRIVIVPTLSTIEEYYNGKGEDLCKYCNTAAAVYRTLPCDHKSICGVCLKSYTIESPELLSVCLVDNCGREIKEIKR